MNQEKKNEQYVHIEGSVCLIMDTEKKSKLLFILNDVNFGDAYEGISLDKPLVPCVSLYLNGDSVELVI